MRSQQLREIVEQLPNEKHWGYMTKEMQSDAVKYLANLILNKEVK